MKFTVAPLKRILTFVMIMIILTDCCVEEPPGLKFHGYAISNLPDWVLGVAYTDWQGLAYTDWQSESLGLEPYIPPNKRNNEGQFRVMLLYGPISIGVDFNDGTTGIPLFTWLGSPGSCPRGDVQDPISGTRDGADTVSIPDYDNNPNTFEIRGYARQYAATRETPNLGYARLLLELLETTENFYRYSMSLEIDGKHIFTVEMTPSRNLTPEVTYPSWFPPEDSAFGHSWGVISFYENDPLVPIANGESPNAIYRLDEYGFALPPWDDMDEYGEWTTPDQLLYRGGMKQEVIDNENKKVTYELLDGTPSSPVFVEIQWLNDKKFNFLWMDKDKKLLKEETLWVAAD